MTVVRTQLMSMVMLALVAGSCGGGSTAPADALPATSAPSTTTTTTTAAAVDAGSSGECPPVDPSTAFPAQPTSVPFPTVAWPEGPLPAQVDGEALRATLDEAWGDDRRWGGVQAVLAVHGGMLVVEEYGRGYEAGELHGSFSIAKTVLHAAVGAAAADGYLDPGDPVNAPEWDTGDPRSSITMDQLLSMTSGLAWEESGLGMASLLAMLDSASVAAAQAERSLQADPGTVFTYSTGSSAVAARALADALGSVAVEDYLRARLFDPLGIGEVELLFDAAGFWVGGGGADMTARDYARLGLLYLRGGRWDGDQLVPEAWIDRGRTPTEAGCDYGSGLRLGRFGPTSYSAEGFLGQNIVMVPDEDLVVVVLASEPRADLIDAFTNEVIDAFRGA